MPDPFSAVVQKLSRRDNASTLIAIGRTTVSEGLYIVVFDQLDPSFDPVAIRDAMRASSHIAHWWNHIPNCFLVSSTESAAQLTKWLRGRTGEVGFFVMKADPQNSEGYLPKRSWEWIRRREAEMTPETI